MEFYEQACHVSIVEELYYISVFVSFDHVDIATGSDFEAVFFTSYRC